MASTKRIRFHHESQAAGFLQNGKENVYSNNKIMADEPAAARKKRTAGNA